MALQHQLSLPSGIDLIAAYTRIQSVQHSHAETSISVQTWASEQARRDELQPVSHQSYIIPWHDEVSLTSAYEALKDFSEFSEAADV